MKTAYRDEIIARILGGDGFSGFVSIALLFFKLLYAVTIITVIVLFCINIANLARSGGNPMKRDTAKRGIYICGGCIAVLGGFGAIYALLAAFAAG